MKRRITNHVFRLVHWLVVCGLVVWLLPVRPVGARGASRLVAQPSAPEVAAAPADGQVVLGPQPAPGFTFNEWLTATVPVALRQAQGPASAVAGQDETATTVLHLPLVLAPQQVQGLPALAMVASPLLGLAPLTVTLTALLDGAADSRRSPYAYTWDFGDGAGADGPASQHVFTTAGVYTITLTAYNQFGEQVVTQPVRVYDPAAVSIGQVDERGGRVLAHEGDLWLDFAPGAVSEPHFVFIQQLDLTSVTTDTVDGSPALEVPGFGLPFRRVELHAARVSDGLWQPHTEFAAPVTITHAYHQEIIEQLLPQSLHFAYWNETANQLESLTSTVDLALGQVWASLQHFSEYGVAGEKAAWQTPTLDATEVALAKGQSSYGYALPLPVGPGGFAPKVNLSYSSAMPNGMAAPKNSDGGWVGVGWTLDLGHMTEKSLALNGASGDLKLGQDGYYYLEEDPSLRIEKLAGAKPGKEYVRWQVSDRNGVVYYFGRAEDGGGSVVLFRHPWSSERCETQMVAYKLYQVVDAHGNTLEIEYNEMRNTDECGPEEMVRESYPHEIRYTTNANANDHHAEYVVQFETEDKGYSAAHENAHGDIHHRLRRIHTWYYPPDGGGPHPIRTLRFDYATSVPGKFSLLKQITLSSAPSDDGPTLRPIEFFYGWHQVGYNGSGWFQRPFLERVRNGYGGEVRFAYALESWSNRRLFQVVTSRTLVDEIGPLTTVKQYRHERAHVKLRAICTSRTPDGSCNDHINVGGFDRFFGFGQVDVSEPRQAWQRHQFNNEEGSIFNGRELGSWVYEVEPEAGGKLYAAVQHRWIERKTPQEIKFVYLSETTQSTCFGQSGGTDLTPCLTQRTVHTVDEWGLPVQETVYDASGQPHLTTVHQVERHPTQWLMRPLAEQLYAGGQADPVQLLAETQQVYGGERWTLPTLSRIWAGTNKQGQARYLDAVPTHDAYGNMVSQTLYNDFGEGSRYPRTTSTQYDEHGILPVVVTNSLGHVTRTEYDYRYQQPIWVSDANQATTFSHYDGFGRLVRVDLPLCPAAVRAGYGDQAAMTSTAPYFERLQQRIDGCTAGETARYNDLYVFYDGLGRKMQAQQNDDGANTILTAVAYDTAGRLVTTGVPEAVAGPPGHYQPPTWANGQTTTEYDLFGRPVRVIAPDGSVTRSEYGRDTSGDGAAPTMRLLTRTFDANGHRKDQVSDEWGNLMRVREFSGGGVNEPPHALYGELVYTYDLQNRLTAVTDAAGNTTQLEYDTLGRKTRMLDPDMGEWRYSYNPLGDLIEQTDAQGVVTKLNYDKLSRLTGKEYLPPAGSNIVATPATRYDYDALPDGTSIPYGIGRRVAMADGAGLVTWSYDAHGRVLSERRTFTGAYAQLANNRDNGAYVTKYAYNAADWVMSVTYPDGDLISNEYTRRGLPQRQSSSMGGDLILDTTYNLFGQMTEQTSGDGLTTRYDYYPPTRSGGRLLQIHVGEDDLHLAYTYDKAGNIAAIYDGSQGVLGERIVYGYDHPGALRARLISARSEGGVLAGYTLGYTYDSVGNMTARSDDGQQISYQYDASQPHAVTVAGDDLYTYDANGNMIDRIEDGIVYEQRWNAFNKLAQVQWQRDGQSCNVQFIHDGDGNRLLKVQAQASMEVTTYYAGQMFEKQFNTTEHRLGEGALANGNCAGATNGVTDFGFTGQRNEADFGLMDFNARYYSPRLGRFISPDSIVPDPATAKGFNRYMYGDGNPLRYNDPSGHMAVCFRGSFKEQGISSSSEGTSDFWEACEQTLVHAGYDPTKHGEILRLKNTQGDIQKAITAILAQEQMDSALPVILIGHSWGGAAALETAQLLDESSFPTTADPAALQQVTASIDLLFLIDSELGGRMMKDTIPGNVKTAVNLHAQTIFPDRWWNLQNGVDYFEGAHNIAAPEWVDFGKGVGFLGTGWVRVGHRSIATVRDSNDRVRRNPVTFSLVADYTVQALFGSAPVLEP